MLCNVQEGFGNVLAVIGSLNSDFPGIQLRRIPRIHENRDWHLTSKELDPQTGLYYFVTRWYDPVIGRFITQEPTGIDGPNLYHYVFNNPINYFIRMDYIAGKSFIVIGRI